jgi:hypothetical protein
VAGAIPTFHPILSRQKRSVSHIGQQPNGNSRIRTDNTKIFNPVLYQLELCSQGSPEGI